MTHVKQGSRARDAESFARIIDVSRETLGRLESFVALLEAWQGAVNLVGESTRPEVWHRHILDSAQVFRLLPVDTKVLLDIGSGAGFPGLVLAIMGVPDVHLVESNRRKAVFLREAARIAGARPTVHNVRIEDLAPFPVDVVTARAVASVEELLDYAAPFLHERTLCAFLKGRRAQDEVQAARRTWNMRSQLTPSISDTSGRIVRLRRVWRG